MNEFKIPIHRFDLNLLPADARKIGSDQFKDAVCMHFAMEYARNGQGAVVAVDDKEISVMAFALNTDPLDTILSMLQNGKLREALPYLEALDKLTPGKAQVLYNLGICYSELGQFDEAIIRLKRVVKTDPRHVHAWVGIGTAYYRMGKPTEALDAFTQALEINPEDGYTRRNLGGILMALERPVEAVPHFRKALEVLPDDAQTLFGLATALEGLGTTDSSAEADDLYHRVIREHPNSRGAEMAEQARTSLAQKRLREGNMGDIRPDVVMYIAQAMKTFEEVGSQRMKQITLEIAMLGRSGLDINNPETKYQLTNLEGEFTGLQLLSYMYAGLQLVDPTADLGVDFSKEYALAKQMHPGLT